MNGIKSSQEERNKKKGREYDVLEKNSIDTQGPFSIKGIDGSKYNLKIVDHKSKYTTTVMMPNKNLPCH